MHRTSNIMISSLSLVIVASIAAAPVAWAQEEPLMGRTTFTLQGDDGGSKFEGIGIDQAGTTFYVSEVTGGEIHRGSVSDGIVEEWMAEGADDRFTARGITTDTDDRIYIAGGPNGIDTERPDMWVYDPDGELLAALKVEASNAFINDVAIGPDGAAYYGVTGRDGQYDVTPAHSWMWDAFSPPLPHLVLPSAFYFEGP